MSVFSDPATVDEFFAKLKVRRAAFRLREFIVTSGNEENLITRQIAGPKWAAEIETAAMSMADARVARALLRRMGATGRFLAYSIDQRYPADDPTGSKIAGFNPIVYSIHGSNRALRISGLPAHYVFTPGDMIQITYGASPLRRQLLEVSEGVTSDGTGLTDYFEITPPFRAGVVAGKPVYIRRPSCQMQFVSYDEGASELRLAGGMTFQAIEVVS